MSSLECSPLNGFSGPSYPLSKFMLFSKIKSYSKQRHLIPSFEDRMGSIYLSLVFEANNKLAPTFASPHHYSSSACLTLAPVSLGPASLVSAMANFTNIYSHLCWDPAPWLYPPSLMCICVSITPAFFSLIYLYTQPFIKHVEMSFFIWLQCFRCLRIGVS